MAMELAEVAAGLPLAASFAVASGIATTRERRRRVALNEAMHELRRPLQVLSLVLPGSGGEKNAADSSLDLAVAALDRLDREINGGRVVEGQIPVSVRPLLEEALERWQPPAQETGSTLGLRWSGDDVALEGSGVDLAQAVDNLINNAIEHGGRKVTLEGSLEAGRLDIVVRDSGSKSTTSSIAFGPRRGRPGRRGHGLRVVGRVAKAYGGTFTLRRLGQGAEARLRLPVPSRRDR